MPEMKECNPGTFCWVELATTDADAGKKFYAGLFGWSHNDIEAGPDVKYSMLQLNGKDLGAMYALLEDQRSQGVPPHWLSYVSVANVDETVEKAKSLGAIVLMEPMDVFDVGRTAMLQDSTGAAFAVWQPGKHCGAQIVNEPGAVVWNELLTDDIDSAGGFYRKLFGWAANVQQMGPIDYTSFMNGERPAAGMIKIAEEWGEVPPNWLVYFGVNDCDAAAKKAESLGGKILEPPTDIPEVGRFAALQDPQGAVFAIIKLARPVEPI